MAMTDELHEVFQVEVARLEEELHMALISPTELKGIKKGRLEGRTEGHAEGFRLRGKRPAPGPGRSPPPSARCPVIQAGPGRPRFHSGFRENLNAGLV